MGAWRRNGSLAIEMHDMAPWCRGKYASIYAAQDDMSKCYAEKLRGIGGTFAFWPISGMAIGISISDAVEMSTHGRTVGLHAGHHEKIFTVSEYRAYRTNVSAPVDAGRSESCRAGFAPARQ